MVIKVNKLKINNLHTNLVCFLNDILLRTIIIEYTIFIRLYYMYMYIIYLL